MEYAEVDFRFVIVDVKMLASRILIDFPLVVLVILPVGSTHRLHGVRSISLSSVSGLMLIGDVERVSVPASIQFLSLLHDAPYCFPENLFISDGRYIVSISPLVTGHDC